MIVTDVAIVGGGIAGASLGYWLAGRCNVVILEAESQPGYHATGRSAALFTRTYGHPVIRGLTIASHAFLAEPPARFGEGSLLQPRGVLWIAREDQQPRVGRLVEEARALDPTVRNCSVADALALCPVLEPRCLATAVLEPNACDIDVHGLHQGYLRSFKARGGHLVTDARIDEITRSANRWELRTSRERYACQILVNAAGAWADEIAVLAGTSPVGLAPKRRTAITFDPPAGMDVRAWPCVLDLDEEFYFKPEAGRLLGSPADEAPVPPSDVQAEELEIALAAARIESATTLRIQRIISKWAGLRTFAPDKVPVVGADATLQNFFWLAGQGGYGIMTAPAVGELAAELILGGSIPEHIGALGVSAQMLSPGRFATVEASPLDARGPVTSPGRD